MKALKYLVQFSFAASIRVRYWFVPLMR